MALVETFADPDTERAYVRSERAEHRSTLRALFLILASGCIVFGLLAPTLLPAGKAAVYDLVLLGLLVQYSAAWYMIGTEYYLRWLWLDASGFAVAVLAVFALTWQSSLEASLAWQTSTEAILAAILFLSTTLVCLSLCLMVGAAYFVANARWFIASTVVLAGSYAAMVATWSIPTIARIFIVGVAAFLSIVAVYLNHRLDTRARARFAASAALDREKAKTEELLHNVLPESVARRLRDGEAVADSFSDLTVIFTDVVGFSTMAQTLSPGHLVRLLNSFFSIADTCAERHGIEKVKTIGDAYLAVSGGVGSRNAGACEAVAFARDLIDAVATLARDSGVDIRLRVGMHTGPVVGGVVGSSRLAYDYWGDTMNIASRIESAATPGSIAISAATYYACGKLADFGPAEALVLKGVGEVAIHRLLP